MNRADATVAVHKLVAAHRCARESWGWSEARFFAELEAALAALIAPVDDSPLPGCPEGADCFGRAWHAEQTHGVARPWTCENCLREKTETGTGWKGKRVCIECYHRLEGA